MKQGLTFDDVLLVPKASEVLPREVNLASRLTQKITLNLPILSAAMDTVTENKLAIALAREGGIGVVHKNLSIEEQTRQVDLVKRSESGMILDPITLGPEKSIGDALHLMATFKVSGLPVVKKDKLVGILTNRDIRFETDLSLPVTARMTSKNLVTVKPGTTLSEAKKVLQKHRIEKLLVVNEAGALQGLITVKDIIKKENFPNAATDEFGRLRVAAAVGTAGDSFERAQALHKCGVDVLVIDTAHGHSSGVLEMVRKVKSQMPDLQVIAGNIATASGTQALIDAGVDAVKVGIGAGSSCTTRIVAGVGVPQLTAIIEAHSVASKNCIPVISDGGMRYSGDIAKSMAAGAESVMLGSMFAGTEESPGETILYNGKTYKSYRGMGSIAAMKLGSKDRYFQSENDANKLVPEGIEGMVDFKGSLRNIVYQIAGGIRASMGYCGAKDIATWHERSEFIQITGAGVKESHPHDINITQESPNYRKPH